MKWEWAELGAVFISYRRGDSSGVAGRLFDRLEQALGHNSVFMDVDSIEPGLDFLDVLNRHLGQCDVMLAVIGPSWLTTKDSHGRRRLDDDADFVRMEVATALARGIRVIPILVDGAAAMAASDLPDDLKALARRQAIEIRHDRFGSDAEQLAATLRGIVANVTQASLPQSGVIGTWRGELRYAADNVVARTWVLHPNGQLVSPHNEFGFSEEGAWRLENGELIVTFPWGTIFRGRVVGQACRGTSRFPETGVEGTFEMHKVESP
ncbi:MAG: toll/interleukin-1 receptor domain-containing protein [Hyphomonadaceae bacterium]|nr:toll/interleukin-1 receptor domain-containing protein [Hyphomonadaceae bacterium]